MASQGKKSLYVDIEFDVVLNSEECFPREKLNIGIYKNMTTWNPQASGIKIPSDIANQLKKDWVKYIKRPLAQLNQELLVPDLDMSALEGKPKLITHLQRERNAELITAKKSQILRKTGKLKCEVCGFDFEKVFGKRLGYGFCEVHHRQPISSYKKEKKTKLEDLAILCSNCHRMIHKTAKGNAEIMSVEKFRQFVKKAKV